MGRMGTRHAGRGVRQHIQIRRSRPRGPPGHVSACNIVSVYQPPAGQQVKVRWAGAQSGGGDQASKEVGSGARGESSWIFRFKVISSIS